MSGAELPAIGTLLEVRGRLYRVRGYRVEGTSGAPMRPAPASRVALERVHVDLSELDGGRGRGASFPALELPAALEGAARALALRCSWCGADPGAPCVTRAAHPVTGRGVLLEVQPHPERARCSWCGGGPDAVDCGAPAHARMLEVHA